MKKYFLFLAILFVCTQVFGQGINFQQNLSWLQIKEKAKSEGKYIFVDCYATWCGPCKLMDKKTYPNDTIGQYVNQYFISVKMQMDTSKTDNPEVKARYVDANQIKSKFNITALPTFLFFAPDGQLVHRGEGYLPPEDFLSLAKEATDPAKSYYLLLERYRQHELPLVDMSGLASLALRIGDRQSAEMIGRDYLLNYLDKLSDDQFFKLKNFAFMGSVLGIVKSSDRVFSWYFNRGHDVDTLTHQPGYSISVVNYVISKEVISPRIKLADSVHTIPEWVVMSEEIKKRFGPQYVNENILTAKIAWYYKAKNWPNYTKYLVERSVISRVDTLQTSFPASTFLNNTAFEIFKYSSNKRELEAALSWSKRANQMYTEMSKGLNDGNGADTQANILYKLGRTKEAITLEEKALSYYNDELKKTDYYTDSERNLKKMKNGLPTWIWPVK